jgi:hypothetical protein
MSQSLQVRITLLLDLADRLERKGAFRDAEQVRADAVGLVGELADMVWGAS